MPEYQMSETDVADLIRAKLNRIGAMSEKATIDVPAMKAAVAELTQLLAFAAELIKE